MLVIKKAVILYLLRSVASFSHIWCTMRHCAFSRQGRFILKFKLEYWIDILVKNGRKKAEIVPIVHDLYDILIGKS